jgi:D-threonate/D-erythronate kinase
MPKLAIIADDLTGLNAVAGEFQRFGFRVKTCAGSEDVARAAANCDVLGIDTNSRESDPEEARSAVLAALTALAPFSPDIVMKQTDSSLHGNVAAELRAALDAASVDKLVFAPACPSLGRLTSEGTYIDQSNPESAIDIKSILIDGSRLEFAIVPAGGELPDATGVRQIVLCDATNDADLDHVVSGALSNGISLFGGSVGLAKALARHLWTTDTLNRPPAFVLLGSLQNRTRTQGEMLMRTQTAEHFTLANNSNLAATAASIARCLVLGRHAVLSTSRGLTRAPTIGGYPTLDDKTRERIEIGVQTVGRAVLNKCRNRICGVLVAGGTTSEIMARHVLGISRIERIEYLDDGTAGGLAIAEDFGVLPLVTKAGNWGSDEILLRSIAWLQLQRAGTESFDSEKRSND